MTLDMYSPCGCEEAQNLLPLSHEMCGHGSRHTVVDDNRNVPHACDGKEDGTNIAARDINRNRRRLSRRRH